jgi:hypothetical protein
MRASNLPAFRSNGSHAFASSMTGNFARTFVQSGASCPRRDRFLFSNVEGCFELVGVKIKPQTRFTVCRSMRLLGNLLTKKIQRSKTYAQDIVTKCDNYDQTLPNEEKIAHVEHYEVYVNAYRMISETKCGKGQLKRGEII